MKVLRQSTRYCRGCSPMKKIMISFTCLISIFTVYSFSSIQSNMCDTAFGQKVQKSPQETIEILKQKWIAEQQRSSQQLPGDEPPDNNLKSQSIECLINDDYAIQCLQSSTDENDVYLPFNFIEKYFDVSGKISHYDGYNRFEFTQSYSKRLVIPKSPYSYHGTFMTFDSYKVELRDRVKCVSGVEGVPVSTQWSAQGYYYAIQIAQFGISHYCKQLLEKPAKINVYENGENGIQSKWKTTNRHCTVKVDFDQEAGSNVVKFSVPEDVPLGSGASLIMGSTNEYALSFDIKFTSNGSLSVVLDATGKKKQYTIHYVTTNLLMDVDSQSNVFYGIGKTNTWRHISRDVANDIKVLLSPDRFKNKHKVLKVSRIILRGEGYIDNITISKSAHMAHFRDASDWLVKNQDMQTGGWKNDILRTFREGFKPLQPGWLSAMGQGQSMSLLARAYFAIGKKSYIISLSSALKPYTVLSENGGVKAVFMNKYVWYEEYPTTPSSFVLNGFIFSMMGLHDYKSLLEDKFKLNSSIPLLPEINQAFTSIGVNLKEDYKLVSKLYNDGMISLKAMLPLYDAGTRTFYDLRHFMLKIPPNVARWDYHMVHVNQLAMLTSLSDDPIFKRYFNNWYGYTKGKFAPSN